MTRNRSKLSPFKGGHRRMTPWYIALLGLVSAAFCVFAHTGQMMNIYGYSRFRSVMP